MDVDAVREHFQQAQGVDAHRQSALAIRTRSGVAVNIWRTYGAARAPHVRLSGIWPDAEAAQIRFVPLMLIYCRMWPTMQADGVPISRQLPTSALTHCGTDAQCARWVSCGKQTVSIVVGCFFPAWGSSVNCVQ